MNRQDINALVDAATALERAERTTRHALADLNRLKADVAYAQKWYDECVAAEVPLLEMVNRLAGQLGDGK